MLEDEIQTPADSAREHRLRHLVRRHSGDKEQCAPLRTGFHSRGYLPHLKLEGAVYFVTFRTADSLPKAIIQRLIEKRKALWSDSPEEAELEMQRAIERELDACHGACDLRRDDCAQVVAEALQHFEAERYHLMAWVIMPNHVHVLVWPKPPNTLSAILQSWKGFAAREINKLIGRTGVRFWQPESFDRWLRDRGEEGVYRAYIENNPVHARLCAEPWQWRWSSAKKPEKHEAR